MHADAARGDKSTLAPTLRAAAQRPAYAEFCCNDGVCFLKRSIRHIRLMHCYRRHFAACFFIAMR